MSNINIQGINPVQSVTNVPARTITKSLLTASPTQSGVARTATLSEAMNGLGAGTIMPAQYLKMLLEYATGITGGGTGPDIGTMAVGDEIIVNVAGDDWHFLIVHKGNPDSSLYPSEFDNGVIVMMKNLYESRQWHTSNVNDYQNSAINTWLNNEFYNLIDSSVRTQIVQVRIPFRAGSGGSSTVTSGINGLQCNIFLLASREVGAGVQAQQPNDGVTLDYFAGIESSSANNRRIALLNGAAAHWWLRSPRTQGSIEAYRVFPGGSVTFQSTDVSYGVRPCLVLPSTFQAPLSASSLSAFQGIVETVESSGEWTAPRTGKFLFVVEGTEDNSLLMDMQAGDSAGLVVGAAGGISSVDSMGRHIEQVSDSSSDSKIKIIY